jgi:hypothetical protein
MGLDAGTAGDATFKRLTWMKEIRRFVSEMEGQKAGPTSGNKWKGGLTARQIFGESLCQSLETCLSGFLCIMRQSQGQIEQRDNGCRTVCTTA